MRCTCVNVRIAGYRQLGGLESAVLRCPLSRYLPGREQKWLIIALSSAYVVPKEETSIKVSRSPAEHDLQCELVIKQELGSKPAHFRYLLAAVRIHSAGVFANII